MHTIALGKELGICATAEVLRVEQVEFLEEYRSTVYRAFIIQSQCPPL